MATTHPEPHEAHADLLQRIQDEMDAAIHAKKTAEARIREMRLASKAARKSVHKNRLAAIHAAQREIHNAKTEKAAKRGQEKLAKARAEYHSGLKKIHAAYKPGGGTYGY